MTTKVVYNSETPKSRQKKYSPSGVCFDFSWEKISKIIQEYRLSQGYTESNEEVIEVYVNDKGVTFYTDKL